MIVKELIERFNLPVTAGEKGLEREVQGGYCGDLLSEVMGNAPTGCVWLTIQNHQNIVAVAVLREMAAIVLCRGLAPDDETRKKAEQEGIPLLGWPGTSYELAGRLFAAGVHDE
jgi:predicted transcriptional regulator